MSSAAASADDFRHITAVLPDDGTAQRLLEHLRGEKGVFSTARTAARGIGPVDRRSGSARYLRRRSVAVQVLTATVPLIHADEIFNYIFEEGDMDRPGGGIIWQTAVNPVALLTLPDDVSEER